MKKIIDVIFEETQVATVEKTLTAISGETSPLVLVRFFDPFLTGDEFSCSERFIISIRNNATLAEVKGQLKRALADNRLVWNRAEYRKAYQALRKSEETSTPAADDVPVRQEFDKCLVDFEHAKIVIRVAKATYDLDGFLGKLLSTLDDDVTFDQELITGSEVFDYSISIYLDRQIDLAGSTSIVNAVSQIELA